jgi:transposase
MLTWEEDVEAAALRAQGWSISAIARHLGRDPKTIRAYLDGQRTPGQRRRSTPDPDAVNRSRDVPRPLRQAPSLRMVSAISCTKVDVASKAAAWPAPSI